MYILLFLLVNGYTHIIVKDNKDNNEKLKDINMNNKHIYTLYVILFLNTFHAFGQEKNYIIPFYPKLDKTNNIFFKKIRSDTAKLSNNQSNYYPLNNNDFGEYIVYDTTTFMGIEGLKYSVVKEILGDTLMSNDLTYKIIKWTKCANSVNEQPYYEFQRKDSSNKIFVYYQGQDYLLYDFTLTKGLTYPSQYSGFYWKVSDKYTVTGFGEILSAIDYQLLDQDLNIKKYITVIENFGLTYYSGDISISSALPRGSFWGGIINDISFGYLLAKKQKINWNEFYPLHIGDFWKYKGSEYGGIYETSTYVKVIKDTLMPDNNTYQTIQSVKVGGPYSGKSFSFRRIDSTGTVTEWKIAVSSSQVIYKFSACLGDTFSVGSSYSYFRFNDKSFDKVYCLMYPDLTFQGRTFVKQLGLYEETFEGGRNTLVGSVINGISNGDTTITKIEENTDNSLTEFKLYQNYPNPFNPATRIKYTLYKPDYSRLTVYSILGKEVKVLVDKYQSSGEHEIEFHAKNLPSGVYIYSLVGGLFSAHKKIIYLK